MLTIKRKRSFERATRWGDLSSVCGNRRKVGLLVQLLNYTAQVQWYCVYITLTGLAIARHRMHPSTNATFSMLSPVTPVGAKSVAEVVKISSTTLGKSTKNKEQITYNQICAESADSHSRGGCSSVVLLPPYIRLQEGIVFSLANNHCVVGQIVLGNLDHHFEQTGKWGNRQRHTWAVWQVYCEILCYAFVCIGISLVFVESCQHPEQEPAYERCNQ